MNLHFYAQIWSFQSISIRNDSNDKFFILPNATVVKVYAS